jgi:hypothetical protein
MTKAEIGEIVEIPADTIAWWLKLDKKDVWINRC